MIRKSTVFLAFAVLGSLSLCFLLLSQPFRDKAQYQQAFKARKQLVRTLKITDLCLFTEARYTRHLSQADLHSAFQDHPMAFEHFPSGSIVSPPHPLWVEKHEVD